MNIGILRRLVEQVNYRGDTAENLLSLACAIEQYREQEADCPVAEIVNLYHEHMPDNPKCRVITAARRTAIKNRWKEAAKLNVGPFGYSTLEDGLNAWGKFFAICAQSDFLCGRIEGRSGRPFLADIDFLTRQSAFVQILENKYHR